MNSPLRIILADDHTPVREGLKSILGRFETPQCRIVGEAASCQELLSLSAEADWDILLLDLSLKDGSSLELIPGLIQDHPSRSILVLSMHQEGSLIIKALQLGARGFINKESAGDTLRAALSAAVLREPYLDGCSLEALISGLKSLPQDKTAGHPVLGPLSVREREILLHLIQGKSSKDIARALDLSVKTVDNHRGAIYGKLRVEGYPQLMQLARTTGLLNPEFMN